MFATSSIQPRTFAQPTVMWSGGTASRCGACDSTISLLRNGDWVHSHLDAHGNRDPWCRPQR